MKEYTSTSDLVKRLQQGGDEAAVRKLVERFGHRILAAAYLLCHDHGEAQDLMIETMQRAVRAISTFRGDSSLFSWLYGILFNLNRMAWRKKARSRIIYTDRVPEFAAEQPAVGEGLDQELRGERISTAISKLTAPLQEVVVLRYYGEMSIREIADTLGIKSGTVKSRLFNAHARLREIVPQEFGGLMDS